MIDFTITLTSDAEPSSGFGTDLINGLVPRDAEDRPVLTASHIKGLMRQALLDVPDSLLPRKKELIAALFGVAGSSENASGLFSVTDCRCDRKAEDCVRTITRTSLNEFGVAKDTSLRTTEAIAKGTVFSGSVDFNAALPDAFGLMLRYALLSIFAVGGSRNRGCGACFVSIKGKSEKPGDLFLKLQESDIDSALSKKESGAKIDPTGDPKKCVYAQLCFETKSPLCLPELPIVGNNTISSGWSIPASAVQGMILTRINAMNGDVATACYESPLFRAWPMFPVPSDVWKTNQLGVVPVRASASHKISKLADENGKFTFCDEKIERYDWDKVTKNAPIKSADGVLIKTGNRVILWRSGDMARNLSAHGVINGNTDSAGGRNLYTIESLDERHFSGFVCMPENAFNLLQKSLGENSAVHIGKSRTVRGSGIFSVRKLDALPLALPKDSAQRDIPAFVVQSPVLIENGAKELSADRVFAELIENAGWGKVSEVSASIQILFGWNRRDKGLQQARLVIAPGSIFQLDRIPENWKDLIAKGLGGGRERGYGAILPHPGIATERYRGNAAITSIGSESLAAKTGWELWTLSRTSGLMPSQIAQLQALFDEKKASAIDFLERQRTDRSAKIWDRWKPVFDKVKAVISGKAADARKTLKVWHDLAVATNEKESDNE